MLENIGLLEVLQKLYAGDAQLHIASWNEGWDVELESKSSAAFAKRKFTADDIAELPHWIESESAKPRVIEPPSQARASYLRLVK